MRKSLTHLLRVMTLVGNAESSRGHMGNETMVVMMDEQPNGANEIAPRLGNRSGFAT